MAWSSGGSVGTAQSKTAGSSIALTTSAAVAVGEVVVLVVAKDNVATTDGATSEVTGVSDSSGNTWSKAGEFTNGQGGAASGATCAIWYTQATTAISSGGTITANFSSSVTAKAVSAWKWAVGSGSTVDVVATATRADDGADPGAVSLSGLTNAEYLFLRGIAGETNSTAQITPTASWTALSTAQTSGGGAASNMAVRGEWRIQTASGATSDPSWTAVDSASVLVALREQATTQVSGSDAGAPSDAATLEAAVAPSDGLAGTEAATLAGSVATSEAVDAAETVGLGLSAADLASAAESGAIGLAASEAVGATDAGEASAALTAAEATTAAEAAAMAATTAVSDATSGSETADVMLAWFLADELGADEALGLAGAATATDAGDLAEAAAMAATLLLADALGGVESAALAVILARDETLTATEDVSVMLLLAAEDAAGATETASVASASLVVAQRPGALHATIIRGARP